MVHICSRTRVEDKAVDEVGFGANHLVDNDLEDNAVQKDEPTYNLLHKAQQPVAVDAPGFREALDNYSSV